MIRMRLKRPQKEEAYLVGRGGGNKLVRKLGLVGGVLDLYSTVPVSIRDSIQDEGTYLLVGLSLIGIVAEPTHDKCKRMKIEVVVVV